ncbi:MAG: hypothetical protein LiPW15_573 [Parcubacteria group bacterium LiPW_15]|nr:MAG: hypothetical protein LiPW15_573 [Parcubacteria group bacterium LiPW_15]
MPTKRFLIEVPDAAYVQEFWREGGSPVMCGMAEVTAESIRLQLLAGAGVAEIDKTIEPQKERLLTLVCISFDNQASITVTEVKTEDKDGSERKEGEMPTITVDCCAGREDYPGQCLKSRCPHYEAARRRLLEFQPPYVGTGFGSLHKEPTHSQFLVAVKEDLANSRAACARAERLFNTAYGCGNDLTQESGVWFRAHLTECKPCADRFTRATAS